MPESGHPIDAILTPPPGPARLLTDRQIRDAVEKLGMIGAFDPTAAKYASYELHVSRVVRRLVPINGLAAFVEDEAQGDQIVIEPGATVLVYSEESINLPPYIHASVQAIGQLFAAGLCAGNTYVDPGSRGAIYIAITNLLHRQVSLPVGCALARVQFFVLGDPVSTVHGGPETRRPAYVRYEELPSHADETPLEGGDLDALQGRILQLEDDHLRRRAVIERHAREHAKAVSRSVWLVALLALLAGGLSVTPLLDNSPSALRYVLRVAAVVAAALGLARVFFGGSVKDWLAMLDAKYYRRVVRRYLARAGFESEEKRAA